MMMAEPAPLEEIYRNHSINLVRLAFLLTGSREQAEDIVQHVFASALKRWPTIEQPLPYLKQAVVNMAKDAHRRGARDRRLVERVDAMAKPSLVQPEIDDAWAQIKRLPDRQRMVVVLHFYEDLALNQIADMLSRPSATIRSDLRRALNRLRRALQ
jgi:RNA polymerase sigma factor (sigma-70 family)